MVDNTADSLKSLTKTMSQSVGFLDTSVCQVEAKQIDNSAILVQHDKTNMKTDVSAKEGQLNMESIQNHGAEGSVVVESQNDSERKRYTLYVENSFIVQDGDRTRNKMVEEETP